ncbi:hypothetical protein K443DRAFT_687228, partial [Laccaria amethystina LaAM-08-1]
RDTRGITANRFTQHHDHHNTMTTTKAADTKPVVKSLQVIPTENGAGAGNNTTSIHPTSIPVYEQLQPSEYREPPAPHTDGQYQNIPVTGQSTRPSEMKTKGEILHSSC